jgi:hypothetical protein
MIGWGVAIILYILGIYVMGLHLPEFDKQCKELVVRNLTDGEKLKIVLCWPWIAIKAVWEVSNYHEGS